MRKVLTFLQQRATMCMVGREEGGKVSNLIAVEWTETHDGVEYRYETDFAVRDGCVQECGTALRYDPVSGKGYQMSDGRRVALTSYAAFGEDMFRARMAADRWCEKARAAWNAANGLRDETGGAYGTYVHN